MLLRWLGRNIYRASNKKRMTGYIKKHHTSIFIFQTGCGKTHHALGLTEKEYNNHFDYIVIICPLLQEIIKPIMLKSGSKTMIMFGF